MSKESATPENHITSSTTNGSNTQQRSTQKNQIFCWYCGGFTSKNRVRHHSRQHYPAHIPDFSQRIYCLLVQMAEDRSSSRSESEIREELSAFCEKYGPNQKLKNTDNNYCVYMIRFNNNDHAKNAFDEKLNEMELRDDLRKVWKTAQDDLRSKTENNDILQNILQIFYTGQTNNLNNRKYEHYKDAILEAFSPKVKSKVGFFLRSIADCIENSDEGNYLKIIESPEKNLKIYTVLDKLTKLQASTVELLTLVVLNDLVLCSERTEHNSVYSQDKIANKNEFRIDGLKLGVDLILYAVNRGAEDYSLSNSINLRIFEQTMVKIEVSTLQIYIPDQRNNEKKKNSKKEILQNVLYEKIKRLRPEVQENRQSETPETNEDEESEDDETNEDEESEDDETPTTCDNCGEEFNDLSEFWGDFLCEECYENRKPSYLS